MKQGRTTTQRRESKTKNDRRAFVVSQELKTRDVCTLAMLFIFSFSLPKRRPSSRSALVRHSNASSPAQRIPASYEVIKDALVVCDRVLSQVFAPPYSSLTETFRLKLTSVGRKNNHLSTWGEPHSNLPGRTRVGNLASFKRDVAAQVVTYSRLTAEGVLRFASSG